jgi:hypothetical protein
MKKLMTCLTAGLLVIGAQSLHAQSATNSTPSTATPDKGRRDLTPEQRREVMKLLGLSRADLKDLAPEERHAKIKEAGEKVMSEFKAKKESGTLTAEDKTHMELLHKFLGGGHKKAGAAGTPPADGAGSSNSN